MKKRRNLVSSRIINLTRAETGLVLNILDKSKQDLEKSWQHYLLQNCVLRNFYSVRKSPEDT